MMFVVHRFSQAAIFERLLVVNKLIAATAEKRVSRKRKEENLLWGVGGRRVTSHSYRPSFKNTFDHSLGSASSSSQSTNIVVWN